MPEIALTYKIFQYNKDFSEVKKRHTNTRSAQTKIIQCNKLTVYLCIEW